MKAAFFASRGMVACHQGKKADVNGRCGEAIEAKPDLGQIRPLTEAAGDAGVGRVKGNTSLATGGRGREASGNGGGISSLWLAQSLPIER